MICKLGEELSKAIAEQQDALDTDDPDWLKQHVPRWKALKDIGLDALAAQVRNFKAESPTKGGQLLSGRAGLAEALGWSLAEAKREHRVEAQEASHIAFSVTFELKYRSDASTEPQSGHWKCYTQLRLSSCCSCYMASWKEHTIRQAITKGAFMQSS